MTLAAWQLQNADASCVSYRKENSKRVDSGGSALVRDCGGPRDCNPSPEEPWLPCKKSDMRHTSGRAIPLTDSGRKQLPWSKSRFLRDDAHERRAHAEWVVRHSSPHDGDSVHRRPMPAASRRSAARIAQWLGRCCLARSQRLARILGCIDIWLFQLAQAFFFFLLLFG